MAQQNEEKRRFSGPRRQGNRGGGGRRFRFRRRVCLYCTDTEKSINWKNTDDLRRFVGDSGQIIPRRKTGLCAKHQRSVAIAIKRARHIALMPFSREHIRLMSN